MSTRELNEVASTARGVQNAAGAITDFLKILFEKVEGREFIKAFKASCDKDIDIRKVQGFAMNDVLKKFRDKGIHCEVIYAKNNDGEMIPYLATLPSERAAISQCVQDMYKAMSQFALVNESDFYVSTNLNRSIKTVQLPKNQANSLLWYLTKNSSPVSFTPVVKHGKVTDQYEVSFLDTDYDAFIKGLAFAIPESMNLPDNVANSYQEIFDQNIEKAFESNEECYLVDATDYVDIDSYVKPYVKLYNQSEDKSFDFYRNDMLAGQRAESVHDPQAPSMREGYLKIVNSFNFPVMLTKAEFESKDRENILKEKKKEIHNQIAKQHNNKMKFPNEVLTLAKMVTFDGATKKHGAWESISDKLDSFINGDISLLEFTNYEKMEGKFLNVSEDDIEKIKGLNNILTGNDERVTDIRREVGTFLAECQDYSYELLFNVKNKEITKSAISQNMTIDKLLDSIKGSTKAKNRDIERFFGNQNRGDKE